MKLNLKKEKIIYLQRSTVFWGEEKKISLNTLGRFSVSSLSYESIQVYFLWQW